MPTANRTSTQARDAQIVSAIQKHLQATSNIPLGGSTYTPAELIELVQSRIDASNRVAAAKAAWHSAVLTERAQNAHVGPLLRELRQYAISAFGATSPVLADFGFALPKRATRTPEQKVAAALKAKATRQARHTVGKKQKKAITGDVTGAVLTPIVAAKPASGAISASTSGAAAGTATPSTPSAVTAAANPPR